MPAFKAEQLSPTALAYLGDAVYELHVRMRYLYPPQRIQSFHRRVVAQVRAEAQARHLQQLEPHLTPTEKDIIRRGRNSASNSPKRASLDIYRRATGFEALIGYLYLTHPERLEALLLQLPLE
ncbi:MAG: Mini-ribonuclease 3 [Elainellaceae cyanobacterium]